MKNKFAIILLIICIKVQIGKGETFMINTTQSALANGITLKYLVREPLVKTDKKKAIILLHGVGSNEDDLFSLANQLPKDVYLICPRGTFTLSPGSYAWYQVDFSTGKPVFNAAQEKQSREALLSFIEQIKETYHLTDVILGGFSQGAIMSFNIGLTNPGLVSGIAVLSGRLMEEIKPMISNVSQLKHLKIFLAHGTQDGTLPVTYAKEAKAYLAQWPLQLSYHEYTMGHQIIAEELKDLNEWLAN